MWTESFEAPKMEGHFSHDLPAKNISEQKPHNAHHAHSIKLVIELLVEKFTGRCSMMSKTFHFLRPGKLIYFCLLQALSRSLSVSNVFSALEKFCPRKMTNLRNWWRLLSLWTLGGICLCHRFWPNWYSSITHTRTQLPTHLSLCLPSFKITINACHFRLILFIACTHRSWL